jgi:hypothetical protein
MINTDLLRLRCSAMVKESAPIDTGNLAFNSIRSIRSPYGFKIIQLGAIAPYGAMLNAGTFTKEGVPLITQHIGWWERARDAVMEYAYAELNGQNPAYGVDYKFLGFHAAATPARQQRFLQSIGRLETSDQERAMQYVREANQDLEDLL